MKVTESQQNLLQDTEDVVQQEQFTEIVDKPLSPIEKSFLLNAERGDCATVRRIIDEYKDNPAEFDINCVDPLSRSALIAAIENENIELIRLLLEKGINVNDGLLHAIKEEYVEAVETLLAWEEEHHVAGRPYTWEIVDRSSSSFTADITPLILAAHKNNYEIIKILLDRGATLPMPHDVRCGCDECVQSSKTDSLRHSQSRINAYRALTSPSLIALSSSDPLLTAFELSFDLRRLSRMETEFRAEYNEMRSQVQQFATSLLDHARTSYELEVMLNFDQKKPTWAPGDRHSLDRLKLAIKYKQKQFVAHPSVQQLLAAIWYEGLPGFRRKSLVGQLVQVAKLGCMFPVYCSLYMVSPNSTMGMFMKKPFVKFICHSSSYAFFLMLLGAASQRVEVLALEWFGTEWMQNLVKEWKRKERGALPGFAECGVILYVLSLIWGEMKSLWNDGLMEYISDLWNIVDFVTNFFYVIWLVVRITTCFITWREERQGEDPYYPREQWDTFEPMLISEGAFAAGMIFSFLKLVHIFSVNPHLGPLQISLGRMIIDIVKFFFIYTLVLFAFGCGLNQLLWYYAELEKNKCYHLPSGLPDFDNNDKACTIWRRYANLFETSQSLFWASFGLVDLVSFELTGIKGFTRFWALLMFGSYSVINVIVLLNMLIAMMSNSYQIISERADTEWKFARTRLWMSYFDDGDTLPPPFNIAPNAKLFMRTFGIKETVTTKSFKEKSAENARERHHAVVKLLIKRYVTAEQRKRDDYGVTEDDVMEIRQDISTLRYELIDILRQNGMKTPQVSVSDSQVSGKKGKEIERRILKDFHIGLVENIVNEINKSPGGVKNIFGQIARAVRRQTQRKKKDWNTIVRRSSVAGDPIGSSQEAEANRIKRQSLRKHILENIKTPTNIDQEKLLQYNPKLSEVPQSARLAYAKFMTKKMDQEFNKTENDNKELEKNNANITPKSRSSITPDPDGVQPKDSADSAIKKDSKDDVKIEQDTNKRKSVQLDVLVASKIPIVVSEGEQKKEEKPEEKKTEDVGESSKPTETVKEEEKQASEINEVEQKTIAEQSKDENEKKDSEPLPPPPVVKVEESKSSEQQEQEGKKEDDNGEANTSAPIKEGKSKLMGRYRTGWI